MFADFQKVGKEHCCIDILKSFVRDGVIALAVSLSIRAGILSGPVALVVSSCMIASAGHGPATYHAHSG